MLSLSSTSTSPSPPSSPETALDKKSIYQSLQLHNAIIFPPPHKYFTKSQASNRPGFPRPGKKTTTTITITMFIKTARAVVVVCLLTFFVQLVLGQNATETDNCGVRCSPLLLFLLLSKGWHVLSGVPHSPILLSVQSKADAPGVACSPNITIE